MLCTYCQHIKLPHEPDNPRPSRGWPRVPHVCLIKHHATFDELLKSADSGCAVCLYFRPFIAHAKLRRQGLTVRSGSDCDSSHGVDYTHCDPFKSVDRGRSIPSAEGGGVAYSNRSSENIKHYVGPGKYYVKDSDDGKYWYGEDDDDDGNKNERDAQDMRNLITAEDKEYDAAFQIRLTKLGLDPGPSTDNRIDENSDDWSVISDPIRKAEDELLAKGIENYAGLQWILSTTERITGPEQLWIVLARKEDQSDFVNFASDDTCIAILTAASIDHNYLEECPTICLNGVEGYTGHTAAALYPGLWKYHADYLHLPQKRPLHNARPVLEFYQTRDHTFPTRPSIQAREVAEDPTCPAVLDLARGWLERCSESHELCELKAEPAAPSRLIDVGPPGSTHDVKLYIVQPDDKKIRYATLTHCWGPNAGAISKLNQSSLAPMTEKIELNSLAKNFQDAITITRGLHLQYIWIDALCIVQDSIEDWAAEAARMAEYYRGSAITISAFSSTDVESGILHSRPVLKPQPEIEVEGWKLYLRPLLSEGTSVTDAFPISDIRKTIPSQPLNERAWTLQERLFSRRILYFTDEQMIWQCRSRFQCEDGQYSQLRRGDTTKVDRDIVDILNYHQQYAEKDKKPRTPTVMGTHWYALVKAYTQRKLTFAKDKLPALSGLAREVHQLTKVRYVAGIWAGVPSVMIPSLLWSPDRDGSWDRPPQAPRRADNRSPSWSWTSIDAVIEHPLTEEQRVPRPGLDPKFLSAHAIPATSDPFGEVSSGHISIKCWTYPYRGLPTFQALTAAAAQAYDWADDDGDTTSKDPHSPDADPFCTFDITPEDSSFWDPVNGEGAGRTFKVAFMCYANNFENDSTKFASQYYFLIEMDPRPAMWTMYRRVGMAVTPSGTLFNVAEEAGWMQETITLI